MKDVEPSPPALDIKIAINVVARMPTIATQ
jgi:hypothetical protein